MISYSSLPTHLSSRPAENEPNSYVIRVAVIPERINGFVGSRVCGFVGSRVRGFAGVRVCVRVYGSRVPLPTYG